MAGGGARGRERHGKWPRPAGAESTSSTSPFSKEREREGQTEDHNWLHSGVVHPIGKLLATTTIDSLVACVCLPFVREFRTRRSLVKCSLVRFACLVDYREESSQEKFEVEIKFQYDRSLSQSHRCRGDGSNLENVKKSCRILLARSC